MYLEKNSNSAIKTTHFIILFYLEKLTPYFNLILNQFRFKISLKFRYKNLFHVISTVINYIKSSFQAESMPNITDSNSIKAQSKKKHPKFTELPNFGLYISMNY